MKHVLSGVFGAMGLLACASAPVHAQGLVRIQSIPLSEFVCRREMGAAFFATDCSVGSVGSRQTQQLFQCQSRAGHETSPYAAEYKSCRK